MLCVRRVKFLVGSKPPASSPQQCIDFDVREIRLGGQLSGELRLAAATISNDGDPLHPGAYICAAIKSRNSATSFARSVFT